MESELDLKGECRTTAIIGVAMIMSVVIYAFVVEMIRLQQDPFTGFASQSVGQLQEVFYGVALVMLFVIRKVRSLILKADEVQDQRSLVMRLRMATIVTFALCEVPAILGLVLFLTGGFHKEFYLFLALSLSAMVIYFPKYKHWEAWVGRGSKPF